MRHLDAAQMERRHACNHATDARCIHCRFIAEIVFKVAGVYIRPPASSEPNLELAGATVLTSLQATFTIRALNDTGCTTADTVAAGQEKKLLDRSSSRLLVAESVHVWFAMLLEGWPSTFVCMICALTRQVHCAAVCPG